MPSSAVMPARQAAAERAGEVGREGEDGQGGEGEEAEGDGVAAVARELGPGRLAQRGRLRRLGPSAGLGRRLRAWRLPLARPAWLDERGGWAGGAAARRVSRSPRGHRNTGNTSNSGFPEPQRPGAPSGYAAVQRLDEPVVALVDPHPGLLVEVDGGRGGVGVDRDHHPHLAPLPQRGERVGERAPGPRPCPARPAGSRRCSGSRSPRRRRRASRRRSRPRTRRPARGPGRTPGGACGGRATRRGGAACSAGAPRTPRSSSSRTASASSATYCRSTTPVRRVDRLRRTVREIDLEPQHGVRATGSRAARAARASPCSTCDA